MKNVKTKPAPLAERVRASEGRKLKSGATRMPGGILSADASHALDDLVAQGWAPSKSQAIARALLEAHKNLRGNVGFENS